MENILLAFGHENGNRQGRRHMRSEFISNIMRRRIEREPLEIQ